MTVTTRGTYRASTVDTRRWPDIARPPKARFRALVAAVIARRALGRLRLRVVLPADRSGWADSPTPASGGIEPGARGSVSRPDAQSTRTAIQPAGTEVGRPPRVEATAGAIDPGDRPRAGDLSERGRAPDVVVASSERSCAPEVVATGPDDRAPALRPPAGAVEPIGRPGPGLMVLGAGGPDSPVMLLRRPDSFYRRLGAAGLVGFGEAYQAGDWDADNLAELLGVFARDVTTIVPPRLQWLRRFHGARHPRTEENTVDGARRNIRRHYDLSNELFALFLDETMTYSSALFEETADGSPIATPGRLADAQRRKINRLLDLVHVGRGTRLLEIGTGWGELAIQAARRGANVHSVTISTEQRDLALRRVAEAGLSDQVRIDLLDYREVTPPEGGYDAIVSVEMIEAVGEKYWPTYFSTVDRLLAPGGRFGLQSITMQHERLLATRDTYTWMHKYIFPGGLIPSVRAIEETCLRHTQLRIQEQHAFGRHYAQTLRLWRQRFAERVAELSPLGFDDVFRRTWNLYLSYCEAGFAVGYLDVHHILLGRSS